MAGLYIHVPFCKSRCHYCNFYSTASIKHRNDFVDVLLSEIDFQAGYLKKQIINSVYFGGGTPSLLSVNELNRIFEKLYHVFDISKYAEITLEANPDDISGNWTDEIIKTPVNRISMGVQSFHDDDLRYLNRIHTASDAQNAVKVLQDKGLTNLTLDLIYGVPGMNIQKWIQNLEIFFSFSIPHLSAYSLTVEEKTPLFVNIGKGKIAAPDENDAIQHFKALIDRTGQNGYIHYEISNFAIEGHFSRHNSIYWTGGHYLGLGPSAHSYNGHSRRWNKPSVKTWLNLKEYYEESFEEEILTKDQRYNEYVMTSLRTIWGCNTELIRDEFGENHHKHIITEASNHIQEGKLELRNNILFLSPKGKLFADAIASDLFI